jgi:septum site-determining protein MinC
MTTPDDSGTPARIAKFGRQLSHHRSARAEHESGMAASRVQGGIFTVMVIRVTDPYDPDLDRDLGEQVARSPAFFANAPVVVDLKDCLGCTAASDFAALKALLRRHKLIAVGVQNASAAQLRAAAAADIAPFASSGGAGRRGARGAERPGPRPAEPDAAGTPAPGKALLVTQPVRSGTQIYARGTDLVVLAPVSAGAEIIADGHIHVYGVLRGRAIAGAAGDITARIFVHRLEAELVCVAGRYLVSEAIAPEWLKQAAQVALINDQLRILPGWG